MYIIIAVTDVQTNLTTSAGGATRNFAFGGYMNGSYCTKSKESIADFYNLLTVHPEATVDFQPT
jgi:hypothetical protein